MKQFSAIAQTFILTSFSALSLLAISPVQAASFRGLGFLDSNYQYRSSDARGVSADGFVVVGGSASTNGSQAFRWTQEDGMLSLGDLASGGFNSGAAGISADGSIVVGESAIPSGTTQAFRWTQADGMLSLGSLSSDVFISRAFSVSADGSVIVGASYGVNGVEAFRWTQSGGMVRLGDLPGGAFSSDARGVSADGSVIVGSSISVHGSESFRWTQVDGMIGLGSIGSDGSYTDGGAYGVSADGSVVVGGSSSRFGSLHEAFVWTQTGGMVNLKDTLIGAGLDLSGWNLESARDVSADGLTIVGNGTNPSGQSEAWIANLSPEPIPEPLTILGSMAAIAFAAGFVRIFGKNKSEETDPEA